MMPQETKPIEHLKQVESLANAVIENAGALVVVLDSEGRITRFNRRCEELSGYTVEEVYGRFPWDTVLPPEDAETVREYAFEALASNPGSLGGRYTNYWLSKDGQKHLIEWSNTLLLDEDGRMAFMVAVGTDITERQHREDELRVKNTALDSSLTAIAMAGLDGRITYVNPSFLRLWRLADEAAVLGRQTTEFWTDPQQAQQVVEQLTTTGQWQGELLARRDDGSTMEVELAATLVTGESGTPLCMMASFLDISEHRQAQRTLLESREQLNEAQRLARIGSWTLDLRRNRLEWSDQIFRLFEIDQNQFTPTYEAFLQAIHPADRDKVNRAYSESLEDHRPYEITHRLLMADGRIKYVREECETLYDAQGQPTLSRGTIQDITRQKISEETISLYANVFRHSAEAIMITDHHNRIIAVNPALTRLTGYTTEELLGEDPNILASGLTPRETYDEMWSALRKVGHWQGEMLDRHKDGGTYPKWITISTICNDDGELVNYVASFTDMTERKKWEEEIRRLAMTDPLTALANRHHYQQRLEEAVSLSRRLKQPFALLLIDLDYFKPVNDTYGHPAGDLVLQHVAKILRACSRDVDTAARLGGDEFAIILAPTEAQLHVEVPARRIIEQLAKPIVIGEDVIRIGASIGISFYPTEAQDIETLQRQADKALYQAKASGRGTYRLFTPEDSA
jgi:diguanylate cyclase (GGDEF)-like protein/PAS domain S-box-containing protein